MIVVLMAHCLLQATKFSLFLEYIYMYLLFNVVCCATEEWGGRLISLGWLLEFRRRFILGLETRGVTHRLSWW